MAKYYEFEVIVRHVVSVAASDEVEAEEQAWEAFLDDQDYWEDVDLYLLYSEDDGDGYE